MPITLSREEIARLADDLPALVRFVPLRASEHAKINLAAKALRAFVARGMPVTSLVIDENDDGR